MQQREKQEVRSKYCQELARKLLRDSGIKEPPIDVEQIAMQNKFVVKFLDSQPTAFSGILHRELKAIGINRDHAGVRKRFSIAHELGHYFLQHPQEEEASLNEGSQEKWRVCEIEANQFAGELLVPRDLLKSECEKLKNAPVDEKVNILAKTFFVSREVLVIQLSKHKLLMKI
ncbi:MAG TPA: ImmA/IrrE family metallo-endopeptidase [Bacteroidota bacterium]|nr:ImmA/IrrE family metallo-endopeptidase [Bacteroidota bacterium]